MLSSRLVAGLDDDSGIFSHIVNDKVGGYFMAVDAGGLGELAGEADYLELLGVVVEHVGDGDAYLSRVVGGDLFEPVAVNGVGVVVVCGVCFGRVLCG